jgi:hypothetical protein
VELLGICIMEHASHISDSSVMEPSEGLSCAEASRVRENYLGASMRDWSAGLA